MLIKRFRSLCERGAAAVEFAIVLPLLVLVIFGTVEFGAAWSQKTDVNHGAREAARLAAVNFNPNDVSGSAQTTDIIRAACSRMGSDTDATMSLSAVSPGDVAVGDVIEVSVVQDFASITGFVPVAANLTSTVQFRLERPATWADSAAPLSCNGL
ncbi:MAG: pilus assembly protein [Acidimicrobiia bacterium]|nr:pilus assembly protein [Acidimicrobiia bacterium]